MLPAILICAFMVKNVATQRTATATLGTTKSCVLIGDDVKMICTVSADCCTTYPRVWKKVTGAVELLNNGGSSDKSKYVEDGVGTTGFNLIIKNVQKSDFGLNYSCSYGVTESNIYYLDDILCNCWECAGQDYGWTVIGTVIGTVIIFFIATVKRCLYTQPPTTTTEAPVTSTSATKTTTPAVGKAQIVLIVGGLTFIISAIVNIPFALSIGYLLCHCVDGTDPWLILLGLGTSWIIGGIVLLCMLKQRRVEYCITVVGVLCSVCSVLGSLYRVPILTVPHASYVVTTGDVMLKCTVTSSFTINSVHWERKVGDSISIINSNTDPNKYSGSTATMPSLTIHNAASSDVGTYICYASNCIRTGHSTTITVDK